ncbi:MAG: hypothetical protein Q8Q90_02015 [bacterium]|nr:hypothetical protein [bacterium]
MSEVMVSEEYWLDEFLKEFPIKPSRPIAFYDKKRDAIVFQLRDCSVTEHEIDEDPIILLEDNHPKVGQERFIGFVIEHAEDLFKTIEATGPEILKNGAKLLDVLKEMFRLYPNPIAEAALAQFVPFLRETEIQISFQN